VAHLNPLTVFLAERLKGKTWKGKKYGERSKGEPVAGEPTECVYEEMSCHGRTLGKKAAGFVT